MTETLHHRMVACPECDALQREPVLPPGGRATCWRCRTVLSSVPKRGVQRMLALAIAAAVIYCIANAYPLLIMESQGSASAISLIGAIFHLWNQDMRLIAVLVFITTVLVPGIELLAMLLLLGSLYLHETGRLTRLPEFAPELLRLTQFVKPWAMLEVFLIGALVSFVKLSHLAEVDVGVAMWAYGVLIVLFAAFTAAFHPRYLWARLEAAQPRPNQD